MAFEISLTCIFCAIVFVQNSAYNVIKKGESFSFGTGNTPMYGYSMAMISSNNRFNSVLVSNGLNVDVEKCGLMSGCSRIDSKQLRKSFQSRESIGATVFSSFNGSYFMICSPHYNQTDQGKNYFGLGICFLGEASEYDTSEYKFKELKPFEDNPGATESVQHGCLFGHSAAITNEGDSIMVGPLCNSDRGRAQIRNRNGETTSDPQLPPLDMWEKEKYLGFATAASKQTNLSKDAIAFATSTTHGVKASGSVYLLRSNGEVAKNLIGKLCVGCRFGAALEITDVDGDQIEDIIVGAPGYSEVESIGGSPKFYTDAGKVFVYLGKHDYSEDHVIEIWPKLNRAQFGASLAAAGDIDGDGYNDFIVGAPFYETSNDGTKSALGAIFVFYGHKDGINQDRELFKIKNYDSTKGIGISIASGLDLDDNSYNDIAAGAPLSGHAIFWRTSPVAFFEAELVFPPVLHLRNCTGSKTCFHFIVNATHAKKRETVPDNIDYEATVTFDDGRPLTQRRLSKSVRKIEGTSQSSRWVSSSKRSIGLLESKLQSENDRQDKFLIKAVFKANDQSKIPMVLNNEKPMERKGYISLVNCGSNFICESKLSIVENSATIYQELDEPSKESVTIILNITNNGEEDPDAKLSIDLGESRLKYSKVTASTKNNSRIQSMTCGISEINSIRKLVCDFDAFLKEEIELQVQIELDARTADFEKDHTLLVSIESDNDDKNYGKKEETLILKFKLDADLKLMTSVTPPNRLVSKSEEENSEFAFPVKYIAQIVNNGPTKLGRAQLLIKIPYKLNGAHLINPDKYEIAERNGNSGVSCESNIFNHAVQKRETESSSSQSGQIKNLACDTENVNCEEILCNITNLEVNREATVRVFFDVKFSSMKSFSSAINFISDATVKSKYPAKRPETKKLNLFMMTEKKQKPIETWKLAVSLLAGILLLVLIIAILCFVGFFKRKHQLSKADKAILTGAAQPDNPEEDA